MRQSHIKNRSSMHRYKNNSSKYLNHQLFTHLEQISQDKQREEHMSVSLYPFKSNFQEESNTANLLLKAKGITEANKQLIHKTRKFMKQSQEQAMKTFLTGTGIYVEEQHEVIDNVEEEDIDQEDMLRYLLEKEKNNDLEDLRRMMKITKRNLNSYSREIKQTGNGVVVAASQFNKQMDFRLMHDLNKIKGGQPQKIATSMKKRNSKY